VYLRALLGEDVDGAIGHFKKKVTETITVSGDTAPAEVLIELLVRLGRYAEAIQASLEFFPNSRATPSSFRCPSARCSSACASSRCPPMSPPGSARGCRSSTRSRWG
jgi:hypothetical protein